MSNVADKRPVVSDYIYAAHAYAEAAAAADAAYSAYSAAADAAAMAATSAADAEKMVVNHIKAADGERSNDPDRAHR